MQGARARPRRPRGRDDRSAAGGLDVGPGLDRKSVEAVIASRPGEVAPCRSGARGVVRVSWYVEQYGRTPAPGASLGPAVVFSNVNDPSAGRCVLEKLASWPFPRPRGVKRVPVRCTFALE